VGVHERTLRRAVNQGSLRARRQSPRTLELPLSERLYVRRSWHLVAALRSALRTEQNVRFALLFGSAARGTDTPTSDVDVLVELRDPRLERVVDLGERLTAASGRPVDVVRLGDVGDDASFLSDVLTEGRVLVDRDKVWPSLRSREPTLRRRGRHDQARRAEAALAGIDQLLVS
jgi:predicted nucleotidyltransferase